MADGTVDASQESAPSSAASRLAQAPFTWEYPMPLLTNRFFLLDWLRWVAISIALTYAFIALAGLVFAQELIIMPWELAAVFLGLILLGTLVFLLIFGNRYDATYTLDETGIGARTGSKGRKVNRVLFLLSLLSGKPGPVGAAMLAESGQDVQIDWSDIRKIEPHPAQRVISICNSWRTVVRLYCPPDLFDEVLRRVREGRAAAPPAEPRRVPWSRVLVALGGLAVVAVGAVLSGAWKPEDTMPAPLFAGGSAALAVLLPGAIGRVAAVGALLGVIASAVRVTTLAMEETVMAFGLVRWRGYEQDTEYLAVTVAGLLLLLSVAVWRVARR